MRFQCAPCFSTFPFVLCVDAAVTEYSRAWDRQWPLHLVRARPLDLSGQACWARLYLLCLFSIPVIHHPSARPQACSPRWTPDLRAGVLCHPFANGDITFQLLKFKPDECCSWSEGWPLTARWPGLEVLFQKLPAVCLGADGTTQQHFSSQPRPDNVSWLTFFTSSAEWIETNVRTWALPACCSHKPSLYPRYYPHTVQHGHSTPNPPFCLTLFHTHAFLRLWNWTETEWFHAFSVLMAL